MSSLTSSFIPSITPGRSKKWLYKSCCLHKNRYKKGSVLFVFFLILKLKCLRSFVSEGKKFEVSETFFFKNVDFEYFSSMTLSFIVIVFDNSLIQGCQTNKRKMLIICFRISRQKNPLWSCKWLWTRDWSYWVCSWNTFKAI